MIFSFNRGLLAVSIMALVQPAQAQDNRDYKCTVNRLVVNDQKNVEVLQSMTSYYVGKEFTIDRRTGIMAGVLKNSYLTKPKIIDSGSSENSFKAITTLTLEQGLGSGTNVHVIVVREYEDGLKKPFVFLDNDEVYMGMCIHF